MCGIAGSVNAKFPFDRVARAMRHRGPDEQSSYSLRNVDLLHVRLSILDIDEGKQPMHYADRYTIVFNGEIYNHKELRQQFNLVCKSASDTETLLQLYAKLGDRLLEYVDGMFAFAIFDRISNNLFIARDRAGKKPFYYYVDGSRFLFASELIALKEMHDFEIDPIHFYQYLRLGSFYRENTPYKKVRELPGGYYLNIDCGTLEIKQTNWWNIETYFLSEYSKSLSEAVDQVDGMLHTAVKRRLDTSDLEVGCFLSGGIDSGLIASIASSYRTSLKTFTISIDGSQDEAPLARMVAQKYATNHTEIKISFDDLENDVEKILLNYGEPFFDSSAIPSYYVSKAAKEYVTVILNGDGADELFGGYRRHVPFSKYDFFKASPIVRNAARIAMRVFPDSSTKRSSLDFLKRLSTLASQRGLNVYLSAGVDIFEGYTQHLMLPGPDYLSQIEADFQEVNQTSLSGLQKLMTLDFKINLFNDLLVKMDIATMVNSQEGRSPFLCKELLEIVPSMPDSYKVRGNTTKLLLRTLAKKYLPPELIHQPKRGFEIPLSSWVNGTLSPMINGYLRSQSAFYPTLIDKSFVENLLARTVSISEEKRAKILWTIFAMEVWYQNTVK